MGGDLLARTDGFLHRGYYRTASRRNSPAGDDTYYWIPAPPAGTRRVPATRCSMISCRKSRGQVEAEISDAMVKLQRERTGRGPNQAKTYIIEDMVIVRLQEVLTPAERQLTGNPHGQSLVKQFHQQMHEIARAHLERIVETATAAKVISIHNDVSTKSGEQVAIYILDRDLEAQFRRPENARKDG
jgi:uncharacterized protein YbcI